MNNKTVQIAIAILIGIVAAGIIFKFIMFIIRPLLMLTLVMIGGYIAYNALFTKKRNDRYRDDKY